MLQLGEIPCRCWATKNDCPPIDKEQPRNKGSCPKWDDSLNCTKLESNLILEVLIGGIRKCQMAHSPNTYKMLGLLTGLTLSQMGRG